MSLAQTLMWRHMTLQIKELGGLPEGEIKLLVERAKDAQVSVMEQRLKEHQAMIDTRLTKTDDAVKELSNRTSELRTSVALLNASDDRQTALLEEIKANGEKWHEVDLDFRAVLIQRVSKIESTQSDIATEQASLAAQMKLLRWIVASSAAVLRACALGWKLIGTEEFWKVCGVGTVIYLLGKISPHLVDMAKSILK